MSYTSAKIALTILTHQVIQIAIDCEWTSDVILWTGRI